ncbi:MAG TPA: SIMPL domain-containing protein [Bacillota bacterium]|nr:SIMPL domain-containing protein [Bacillota bacterium]
MNQALALAVADARAKAQTIAGAAGLALGAIGSISYDVSGGAYPMGAYGLGGGAPVSAGRQSVTVNVRITFAAS